MKALNSFSLQQFFPPITPSCNTGTRNRSGMKIFFKGLSSAISHSEKSDLARFSPNGQCLAEWEALGWNADVHICRYLFLLCRFKTNKELLVSLQLKIFKLV